MHIFLYMYGANNCCEGEMPLNVYEMVFKMHITHRNIIGNGQLIL